MREPWRESRRPRGRAPAGSTVALALLLWVSNAANAQRGKPKPTTAKAAAVASSRYEPDSAMRLEVRHDGARDSYSRQIGRLSDERGTRNRWLSLSASNDGHVWLTGLDGDNAGSGDLDAAKVHAWAASSLSWLSDTLVGPKGAHVTDEREYRETSSFLSPLMIVTLSKNGDAGSVVRSVEVSWAPVRGAFVLSDVPVAQLAAFLSGLRTAADSAASLHSQYP